MQLNQVTFTVQKPIDPADESYQIGFVVEGLYGSDARYYHLMGVDDRMLTGRYQLIPAQAHVDVHLPWFSRGGLDAKAGILLGAMGVETLDPTTRPFYTLSYTSEYSSPFEHLGALFTWHARPGVDVTVGVDTGNQTTFGRGDPNDEAAGYFGVTLGGLAGGKLTITQLSRIGPEDAIRSLGKSANGSMRYWNDIDVAYALNDRVSLTGEVNYVHDEGLRADAESVVGFAAFQVTPVLTFNARAEVYRDNTGLLVTSFPGDTGYMQSFRGGAVPSLAAPATTYGALTLGVTYKPAIGHGIHVFQIRPEIRFDRSLNGTTPFNDNRTQSMFTFGADATMGF